jgi:hypothetical protein
MFVFLKLLDIRKGEQIWSAPNRVVSGLFQQEVVFISMDAKQYLSRFVS